MKKIIDGKLYNTETADNLAIFSTEAHYHYTEELYRTKRTHRFFLHRRGLVKWEGNQGCWGEDIITITESEARSWAEKHITADEYIEIFGEVEEA